MNLNTWLKGFGLSVILPLLSFIYESVKAGGLHVDVKALIELFVISLIAYVIKSFFPRLPSDYPVPPDSDTTRTTINR